MSSRAPYALASSPDLRGRTTYVGRPLAARRHSTSRRPWRSAPPSPRDAVGVGAHDDQRRSRPPTQVVTAIRCTARPLMALIWSRLTDACPRALAAGGPASRARPTRPGSARGALQITTMILTRKALMMPIRPGPTPRTARRIGTRSALIAVSPLIAGEVRDHAAQQPDQPERARRRREPTRRGAPVRPGGFRCEEGPDQGESDRHSRPGHRAECG